MKKEIFIILLAIFSLILITSVKGAEITGEVITGKASEEEVAISIFVTGGGGAPALSIINPRNETYITNESIFLSYSASGQNTVKYNLDNTNNITITFPMHYFHPTQGSHTLYLYATNSHGTTARNVSFSVNSAYFTIIDDEFETTADQWESQGQMRRNEKRGESTDFLNYSYEELQNLEDIIFHRPDYGKMFFTEAINLIDDLNPTDNIIDINSYINMSFNRIELNSTALPNFNKSATLRLYNLTFSNPRIAKDGVVCPSTICVKQSYFEGTLVFTVTHFTSYSAEETPAGETTTPSGGGRGGRKTKRKFSVDKEKIKITLKKGETKKQQITIKNIGDYKLSVNLENSKLKDFLKINETGFDLNPAESKTITLDFTVKEDTIPDLYTGKLIIKADGIEKEIFIIIEVESEKPLFDAKIKIPEKFLYIMPREELVAEIALYNIEETEKVDVTLDYIIKDEQGNTIISEQETRAVKTELSFIKTFKISEDAKYGTYTLYVKVTYNGEVASASSWFSISKKPFFSKENIIYILIIFIIIVLLVVLIELRILRKYIRTHGKIKESTLIRRKLIKSKRSYKK